MVSVGQERRRKMNDFTEHWSIILIYIIAFVIGMVFKLFWFWVSLNLFGVEFDGFFSTIASWFAPPIADSVF